MNIDEKRKLRIKLASYSDAPKTLALVTDTDSCAEDFLILKTAAAEVGLEKIVPYILDNDPVWSLYALQYIPNLGDFEEPLIKKAAVMYEGRIPAFTGSTDSLSKIIALEFNLDGNARYGAWFTMWWFTPPISSPANWQPLSGTPNSGSWVKGGKILVDQSQTIQCSSFALTDSPLNAGDTVMMAVYVAGNNPYWLTTGFYFTYDPNSKDTAKIVGTGNIDGPSFSKSIVSPSD